MRSTRWVLLVVILAIIIIGLAIWHGGMNPQPVAQGNTVHYACLDGKTIDATYVEGSTTPPEQPGQPPQPTGSVSLVLSDGRSMTLPQTISGSGIRYANPDESLVFWSKGNGAFIVENNQQTFMGCVSAAPDPGGLPNVFASGSEGFSMRYPDGYAVKEGYQYQEMGPGKDIGGVKFTIPTSTSQGTNLGQDTYLSVESVPNATSTSEACTASRFLEEQGPGTLAPETVTENGTTYSVASSTGAGAGNRYEEWVYALPGTNPCRAVRYFIHYSVIENYPAGTVKGFDHASLIEQFDKMRQTLKLI